MKNSVAAFLIFSTLGMGGWAVWENQQRNILQEKLSQALQERDTFRVVATRKLELKAQTEVKSDGPQGLGPEHSKALEDELLAEKPKPPPREPEGDGPVSGMARMMKDPAMRDMVKAQMRSQMDVVYRDLFDMLGLDPEKQDKLSKLLADRAGAGMELGLAMMGGEKLSPEVMKQRGEAMKKQTEESDKALKEMLGEKDFAQFERYEKSQLERQQLKTLNSQLKDKGLALSEEAESQLMDAMYQERSNFKYDVDLADQKNFDPEKFTEANMLRFEEQQKALQAQVLRRAETILSPEQLDIFRQTQEQQAAMEKLGRDMGMKMLKGK
jgi:hypothetical protein